MATNEYGKKLVKAIPCNRSRIHKAPTIEDLRGHAIKLLKNGAEPPAIADPSAPKINVLADWGTCCNQIRLFLWLSMRGTKNVSMTYCNDLLQGMGFNIPSSEKHYVWRYEKSEATIHMGEANIDRALYDIGVQMVLRVMKEGLIGRIFDDEVNVDENYSLFDDYTIPKNIDEALVWETHEEEKSLLKISDFDTPAAYNKKVKRLYSIAEKKILLSTLKSRFLQNATRILSKKVHSSSTIVSDGCNCPLLSLPMEIQKKILFYLCRNKMYAEDRFDYDHGHCNRNMGCYQMKELVQFSLASKSCYKIFCNVIYSFQTDENMGKIDADEKEKNVRFHHFDEFFEGMTPHDIARDYDKLIHHRKHGVCICYNSRIGIRKCSWFDENKLVVCSSDY